jgi:hypothetical protein
MHVSVSKLLYLTDFNQILYNGAYTHIAVTAFHFGPHQPLTHTLSIFSETAQGTIKLLYEIKYKSH